MIKFVEEKICQLYGNPIRILSDGDPKFDSSTVKDYGFIASIDWKIISAYNTRGNSKVEGMVGTLNRAIRKVLISNKDRGSDECLGEIFGGYRRIPGIDRKSPFEILFDITPKFTIEAPPTYLVAFNTHLAREFEIS